MYKAGPWRGTDERGGQTAGRRRDLHSRHLRADRPVHRAGFSRPSPGANLGRRRHRIKRHELVPGDGRRVGDDRPACELGLRRRWSDAHDQNWRHATTFVLPANSLVHVTIYQFDGQSGLRNPFIAQATGIVGGSFELNGKPTQGDWSRHRVAHFGASRRWACRSLSSGGTLRRTPRTRAPTRPAR